MSSKNDIKPEIDDVTGMETTGHSWDGIKELNTPLPRWWLWTFYATIIFSLGYVIVYPAIPLLNDATKGTFGWSSRAELSKAVGQVDAKRKVYFDQIAEKSLDEVVGDEKLRRFAISAGQAAFKINCIQCHGSGASGSPGYPNLNDDEWVWGGTVTDIYTTIKHGIRSAGNDDTRVSEMPAFGADEILEPADVALVAAHVLELGGKSEPTADSPKGAALYQENCASCHGEKALGSKELGAPNLVDAIWLYGGDLKQIVAQLNKPKHGVMPAWNLKLSDVTIKELAVYVHSLGGGEASK